MGQLPSLTREQLSSENQKLWDGIYSGRTPGGGPYAVLMHSPQMAAHFSAVEDHFRNHGKLDPVDKELIILAIARAMNVRYPWSRHEIRAKQVGMRPEALETLRANTHLDALNAHERLVVEMTRTLLHERKMPDEMFARVQKELGNERLVEAVGLVAHYNFISMVARTFDLDAPPGTVTF
ncbi:MAG: carboxymuconolactone decarboxylase family protein [Deltaproteobacteria bacterium]|nr:carboxymuconolactone decarboxylase family protein [Deltaproteobacteria bacterium]